VRPSLGGRIFAQPAAAILRIPVSNVDSGDVSAYDIAADGALIEMAGSPFSAGVSPIGVAASPDGKHLYVSNQGGGVSAYDIGSDGTLTEMTGSQFAAGTSPFGVVVTPNQPPVAAFTSGAAEAGSPTSFNASTSADPDGSVARFDWGFGDGSTLPDGGPTPTHTYASVGNYDVTVTVTDNEGCSTTIVYTGQTTSCNGSPVARQAKAVAVSSPPSPPAPKTKIKGKPKYEQPKDTHLRFSSSIDGSTFKCRLDKSKYKGCTSPKNYKDLKPGKHTFLVYAISPEGVADESPSKLKFKVEGGGD
jgi:PKD repeat protein